MQHTGSSALCMPPFARHLGQVRLAVHDTVDDERRVAPEDEPVEVTLVDEPLGDGLRFGAGQQGDEGVGFERAGGCRDGILVDVRRHRHGLDPHRPEGREAGG
jgi:hypothetical protein